MKKIMTSARPSSPDFELLPTLSWEDARTLLKTSMRRVTIEPQLEWFDHETGYPLYILDWWLQRLLDGEVQAHLHHSINSFYVSSRRLTQRDNVGPAETRRIMNCVVNISQDPDMSAKSLQPNPQHTWIATVQLGHDRIGVLRRSSFQVTDTSGKTLYMKFARVLVPGGARPSWIKSFELKPLSLDGRHPFTMLPMDRDRLFSHHRRMMAALADRQRRGEDNDLDQYVRVIQAAVKEIVQTYSAPQKRGGVEIEPELANDLYPFVQRADNLMSNSQISREVFAELVLDLFEYWLNYARREIERENEQPALPGQPKQVYTATLRNIMKWPALCAFDDLSAVLNWGRTALAREVELES